jgi:hypothetical protein
MKKLIFITAFFALSFSLFSQITIDSISSKATYCEIVGTQGFLSSKLTIMIDYDQKSSVWKPQNNLLKSEDGKPIKFNSMIDVLNLMHSEGWDFVNAYTIGDAQKGYVYHWILKRKE